MSDNPPNNNQSHRKPALKSRTDVIVEGRTLSVSNLDKVLFPERNFTKGQVIDYYLKIAPVLLPHLKDRPLTLHRFPNGVDKPDFYEKNCPKHRPDWVTVVDVNVKTKTLTQCLAQDTATLAWLANLASLEMHPNLAKWNNITTPTKLTFDLDPGPKTSIIECCQVALEIQDLFSNFDMQAFPKTSGSKGMQIDVPLNTPTSYEQTKPFARAVAQLLQSKLPKLAVFNMDKSLRDRKVLVDWSQNDQVKTTIAAYSLRARKLPWVSTPITWEEVKSGANASDLDVLRFETEDVLHRVKEFGDLSKEVETLQQNLPILS